VAETFAGAFARLEMLREPVLRLLEAQADESIRRMWSGDAKSLFTLIRAAADLYGRGARAEESIAYLIQDAQSRCGQVASELHALGDQGQRLESELLAAFADLRAALGPKSPPPERADATPIEKISPTEYRLSCAVCGTPAVILRLVTAEKPPVHLSSGQVECAGITRSVGLRAAPEKIFAWMEAGDLAALHSHMEDDCNIDGGLDAWCPQCRLIYCRAHYSVREEWDEGFYDCSRGTCPQGHTRIVDD
jgi:hypothetical protein